MAKLKNELDISVLIPTYNRAESLRDTLEAMCLVERDGLAVEFVVIDNNSTDHTKDVVESFPGRLPVRYLFEPKPGKNCALNKALNEVRLGEIVVFADDDVSPYENWLIVIRDACARWPTVYVFSGQNEALWPGGKPEWIRERWGSHLSLGDRDQNTKEGELSPTAGISGTNMWIRRRLFDEGRRFDERFGPRSGRAIAGSEKSFEIVLRRDGYKMVYIPDAIVRHRPELKLREGYWAVLKKAWMYGRGGPLMYGIPHLGLFQKSPSIWYVHRVLALGYAVCRLVLAYAHRGRQKRVGKSVDPAYDIAYSLEAMRLAARNGGKAII